MSATAARRFSIGEVARLSGVPAKTIRYYEDVGLLPAAHRAANGYRRYDQRAVDVLRFVARARNLGFAMKDVESLLALWADKGRSSREVRTIASEHVAAIEQKIAELEGMRATLAHLIHCCHGDDRPDCPILEELAHGEPTSGRHASTHDLQRSER
jgi:MerR family copper efflux transcriptional regulator